MIPHCYYRKTTQQKTGMQKASPFPKLPLENYKRIVYNHLRNNQRIFACPMIATGNLMMVLISYNRLSPIGVGDSQFTFCGGCQGM